jgi:hypothetical protein
MRRLLSRRVIGRYTLAIYAHVYLKVPRWKVGDEVVVPWGIMGDRPGVVIGFTPQRVRVKLTDKLYNFPRRTTVVAPQTLKRRKRRRR